MSRRSMKPSYPFMNTGKLGRIIPFAKVPVMPGQSLKTMNIQVAMQSVPIKRSMNGAYVDYHVFYVPHRLIWDGWVDFIMTGQGDVPTHVDGQPAFFTKASNKSKLYGLAYEHVVNNFFRQREGDVARYEYDAGTARAPAIETTAEYKVSKILVDDSVDVTIPVVNDEVSVRDMKHALKEQRALEHEAQSTGLYDDFLRRFGVKTGGKIIERAEHVFHRREWIMPSKSIDQSNGNTVQSYFHNPKWKMEKAHYFQEHGYLVGVMMVRPKRYNKDKRGSFEDAYPNVWHEHWTLKKYAHDDVRTVTGNQWIEIENSVDAGISNDAPLMYGEVLNGLGLEPEGDETTFVQAFEPQTMIDHLLTQDFSGMISGKSGVTTLTDTNHFLLDGKTSFKMLTP